MIRYIQEYLSLGESLAVIFGVVLVVVQIRQQTKISRADHERQRKQSTIEFYNLLSSESYELLNTIGIKKLDLSSVNSDKEFRKSVVRYLGRLERLATGVATDVYDFDILCIMAGRYLIKKYEQFETYIEESRNSKNAPLLYREFELLIKDVKKYIEAYPDRSARELVRIKLP